MNPVRKRPAYLFAKDFQIENVLGNLQGYKIATGQLEKSDIDEVSKKYGADESLVFGSLINKAGETPKRGKRDLNEEAIDTTAKQRQKKRRRRRRRRREKSADCGDANSTPTTSKLVCTTGTLHEPLSIPSSLLAYGPSDDESSANDQSNQVEKQSSSGESSDEETTSDFFGLTGKDPEEATVSTHAECTMADSTQGNDRLNYFQSCSQPYPEVRTDMDEWDDVKHKYKEKSCSLSTYKCWKCKRIGHLAEDCTVQSTHSPDADTPKYTKSLYQDEDQVSPSVLKNYFKRCHILRNSKNSKCSECSAGSNLAFCLDCGLVLCDGRSHLTNHLMSYPTHNKLYSFKLRRLIKCCKPSCGVVDASKLLMCSTCLSKQFNSHYNMVNATWSKSGLRGIPNTLACEQHFLWHRINCANTLEEPLLSQAKLENGKQQNDGLLSEFYF